MEPSEDALCTVNEDAFINVLINERTQLLKGKKDFLITISNLQEALNQHKIEFESGEIIRKDDLKNQPEFLALIKENQDLNLLLASRQSKPVRKRLNKLPQESHSQMLTNGNNIRALPKRTIADTNHIISPINQFNSPVSLKRYTKLDSDNFSNSIPLKETLIRFKIINISSWSKAELTEELYHANEGLEVRVEQNYMVKGKHRAYRNAFIMIKFDKAAAMEEYQMNK